MLSISEVDPGGSDISLYGLNSFQKLDSTNLIAHGDLMLSKMLNSDDVYHSETNLTPYQATDL